MQFRHITLPLLKPSILVALLFRTLDAFRVFDLIWVLTGGGPGGTTESISIYAYKVMFAQTRFGYGSAMILVMALAVGIISFVYIKLLDVKIIGE
jgi:multiple sugar transport system permease protein